MTGVEALYREHHRFVWRSLRRMGVPHDGLEDAAQEVFLVAARRLGEFEGRSSPKTWLFAISMGVSRNEHRARGRRDRRMRAIAHVQVSRDEGGSAVPDADARLALMDLLMKLDEQQRAIVVLVELEGMTGQEAADALDLSLHGVYRRLRKARSILERALDSQAQHTPEFAAGGAQ